MRLWWKILVMATAMMLLPGCGTVAGISQTGIVLALAVDPGPAGQYTWSFMFPNPTITPSSESSIKPSEEFYVLQAQAPSLTQAVEDVSTLTDRYVYLGDVQFVALNVQFPAPDVVHLIHLLINTGEFPPRAWVTMASPSAKAVLKTSPPEEVVPTVFLSNYFSCHVCHPVQLETRVWQVWDDLLVPSHTAVIPWSMAHDRTLMVNRSVWLTPQQVIRCSHSQTIDWAMAMGKYDKGALMLPGGKENGFAESLRLSSSRQITRVHYGVMAKWNLTLNGHWEAVGEGDREQRLNQEAEHLVLHHILVLYQWARKHHADPFGVRNQEVWTSFAPSSQMPPLEVTVHCRITPTARTG
ncbi:hypothetical protein [Sulfobacillus thermosulfidooxidans]|uniref:Ger(x)C family spore germination protein n=1 Tax=Sulfobacillus thermosulfidooxidans TaxID=28034 RepID=UPI0006B5EEFC|nr:hypothetical protein [Sulfobacillus thermosulfidooxidans]